MTASLNFDWSNLVFIDGLLSQVKNRGISSNTVSDIYLLNVQWNKRLMKQKVNFISSEFNQYNIGLYEK